MHKIKKLYANSKDQKDKGILDSTWDYPVEGHGISMEAILKEINGYDLTTGKLLESGSQVQSIEPGKVSSGIGGLYSGVITEKGNHSLRHDNADPSGLGVHPNWTFSWPDNTRVLWNRGSVDKKGQPRDKDREIVSWDGKKWVEDDVMHIAAQDK